jgi:hypothetical protein
VSDSVAESDSDSELDAASASDSPDAVEVLEGSGVSELAEVVVAPADAPVVVIDPPPPMLEPLMSSSPVVDASGESVPLPEAPGDESKEHATAAHPSSTQLRISDDRTCYAPPMRAAGLVMATLLVGCRTSPSGRHDDEAPIATTPVTPEASLDEALGRISADDLRLHIETLASDEMKGRQTPSPELDEAAAYVASTMAASGIEPTSDGRRRISVECGPMGESAFNVVGIVRGSLPEYVVVSAHYDHVGEASGGDDRVFNGANDNASGVGALLEIADVVAHLPEPPRRSVAFVAFCGEEKGLRGSSAFVSDPLFPLSSVVAVLNLEMLGHPDPADPRRIWVTGHAYSTLRVWLDRAGAAERVTFVDGAEIGPVEGDAFERSDNYPFASAGIVAHTIAAGPLDEHYHAVSDEASRIDTDAMVPMVRALARATLDLASADDTPAWTGKAPAHVTRRASRTSRP